MKKAFKILNVVCIVTILLLSVFSTLSPIIDTSPKNIIKAYEQPFSHDCKNSAKTEQEESNELIDCNSPTFQFPPLSAVVFRGVQRIPATAISTAGLITEQIQFLSPSTNPL